MLDESRESVAQIDELNLDKECIRLPGDYLKWSSLAADKKRDLDEVQTRLKVVMAELTNQVRENPQDFGLDKVTEAAIQAAVIQSEKYSKVTAKVRAAQHELDLANAVVWALEHKKRALTLLVDLHGMGYFSNVKVSREGKEAVEEMTKRAVRKRNRDDE